MQVETAIIDALEAANVPRAQAPAAAESVRQEIDQRFEMHVRQLATKADIARMEGLIGSEIARLEGRIGSEIARLEGRIEAFRADMHKAIADQTWKLAATVITAMGMMAALLKLMA